MYMLRLARRRSSSSSGSRLFCLASDLASDRVGIAREIAKLRDPGGGR